MTLHLSFELPEPRDTELACESPDLNAEEIRIIKEQIYKNTMLVDEYIGRLDLLVNKEKYPKQENFVQKIRDHLYLLMEENDTFRKVLRRHHRQMEEWDRRASKK